MRSSANKAYPVVRSIFILLVLISALCAGLHNLRTTTWAGNLRLAAT